jgi:hypothetical protein
MEDFSPAASGSVQMTVPQIVEYIRAEAAEKASQAAREKLNFFLGGVSLVGAVAVGAMFLTVDRKVEEQIRKQELALQVAAEVSRQTGDALKQTKSEMREEIQGVTILPLLLAASNRVNSGNSYDGDVADSLIELATKAKDTIESLSGNQAFIADTIIETAFDNFYAASDRQRARKLYDVFGKRLLENPGIYWTMARIASEGLIGDVSYSVISEELLADLTIAPSISSSEMTASSFELFTLMRRFAAARYSVESIEGQYKNASDRIDGFNDMFESFLRGARTSFESDGIAYSSFGIENVGKLESLIMEVADSGK